MNQVANDVLFMVLASSYFLGVMSTVIAQKLYYNYQIYKRKQQKEADKRKQFRLPKKAAKWEEYPNE